MDGRSPPHHTGPALPQQLEMWSRANDNTWYDGRLGEASVQRNRHHGRSSRAAGPLCTLCARTARMKLAVPTLEDEVEGP